MISLAPVGNHAYVSLLDYSSAIECYTEALELYPKSRDGESGLCDHERAVCFANRAACHMKKVSPFKKLLGKVWSPSFAPHS